MAGAVGNEFDRVQGDQQVRYGQFIAVVIFNSQSDLNGCTARWNLKMVVEFRAGVEQRQQANQY
jgi:hypothetical protein